MALPLSNTFETGLADETVLTIANSDDGSAGNAFDQLAINSTNEAKFDDLHPAHGTLGLKIVNNAAATVNFGWLAASTGGDWTEVFFRLYMYFTANPANTLRLIIDANSSASRMAHVDILASGFVRLADIGFVATDSNLVIPLNTQVRLEVRVLHSATVGEIEGRIYEGDSGTLYDTWVTPSNRNTGVAGQQVYWGQSTGVNSASTFWLDDLAVAVTGWIGPVASSSATYLPPLRGGRGSAW